MSTQDNTYIIVGVKFGYDEFKSLFKQENEDSFDFYDRVIEPHSDSAFDTLSEEQTKFLILYDGRNGKYVIVGKPLYKTKVYQGVYDPVEVRKLKNKEKKYVLDKLEELTGNRDYKLKPYVITKLR